MKRQIIFIAVAWTIVLIAVIFALVAYNDCFAEEMYVLCKPEVEINVRHTPRKGGEIIGNLECGDAVQTDGKKRNGYVHVTGLTFEYTDGWIFAGLLIAERPYISEGHCQIVTDTRVAARHYIGGKRRGWIRPGQTITVYAVGEEWTITDRGYVRTEFLTLNYPKGGW